MSFFSEKNNVQVNQLSTQLAQNTNKIDTVSINAKYPFGTGLAPAKGDGTTDDTIAIQSMVDFCITNKLALFVPNGTYRLTSTITIPSAIYIFGVGCTGLSTMLGGAQSKLLIDHAGTGIAFSGSSLQFGGGVIEDIGIVCGSNFYADTTMIGVSIYRFNHLSFNRVSFQDFRAGVGVKFIAGAEFGGQYSSFTDCKFGMCLIGASIENGNGYHFINCMFDGNQNGSWINNYTTGVPDNSYGVYANGGDSHKVIGCRFQGFMTGVYMNTNGSSVTDSRFEMCTTGIHFGTSSQKCTLGTGCKNVNYLLLTKNGLPDTGRYGVAVKNEGAHNTIMPFEFASCSAISETGTNTLRKDVQHVRIYVPEVTASINIPFSIEPYYKHKNYKLKKVKISAGNWSAIDKTYANRWNFAVSGTYVETTNITNADNTFLSMGDSPNARSNDIDTFNFTKYGSATTLQRVVIDLIVEPY